MTRTVVVGASTGLGRCLGVGLAQRGGQVALLARRKDKLEDAAREAGAGTLAIACDVTDEASCRAAIDEAAEGLGGIDALVYAAAIGPIGALADTTADAWRSAFETNVMGASLVTAAAIGHLTASRGLVVFMSTVGASHTPPWPGLGVYQVTKAALERLVEAWRAEHPTVGFTRLIMGECAGGSGDSQTQFNAGWDHEVTMQFAPLWFSRNYLSGALIDVEHFVTMVDALVNAGSSMNVPSIVLTPRPLA
jgi:NAD(P)-dependent dehydrogenase (short-subunit alcohol dehydrogenase family)